VLGSGGAPCTVWAGHRTAVGVVHRAPPPSWGSHHRRGSLGAPRTAGATEGPSVWAIGVVHGAPPPGWVAIPSQFPRCTVHRGGAATKGPSVWCTVHHQRASTASRSSRPCRCTVHRLGRPPRGHRRGAPCATAGLGIKTVAV